LGTLDRRNNEAVRWTGSLSALPDRRRIRRSMRRAPPRRKRRLFFASQARQPCPFQSLRPGHRAQPLPRRRWRTASGV